MPQNIYGEAWNIARISVMASIIILLTILCIANANVASAQSGVIFQKILGNSEEDAISTDVAVDSLGNIYVTGSVLRYSPGNFSEYSVVFLLKCDSTGALVWQRVWSGNTIGTDYPNAVAVDSSGNVYVTGWTSSFGHDMGDVLLLKFNSSGSLVWQRTYGSNSNDEGMDVAVDSSGNVYVTGAIGGFGQGSWDVLLLKCDSAGNLLWQKTWGGISTDHGCSVAVDPSGSVYVTGTTCSYGTCLSNAFLLKFDSSGSLIWQKTWGPPRNVLATGNGAAVDSSGNIYVTGYYKAPYDILLLKFNSSGDLLWQRTWDSGSWDWAEAVEVDSSGSIYVTGCILYEYSGYDALLAKFDSSGNHAGIVSWGSNEPGYSAKGSGVAVDSSGGVILTGLVDSKIGPPYSIVYPNGTIGAPSFGSGIPDFTLDTPTFQLDGPVGVVEIPSWTESQYGGTFVVKFTSPSYRENYTEANVLDPSSIVLYVLVGSAVALIGALATIFLQKRRKAVTTQPVTLLLPSIPAQTQAQNTIGFIFSLIGGISIFTMGLLYFLAAMVTNAALGTFKLTGTIAIMSAVGFICGAIVVIGAILGHTAGKHTVGGILVIVFSLISIFGLGGLLIGLILGTIGGALGLAKPNRTKAALGFALGLVAGSLSIFWGAGIINEALQPPSGWAIFTIGRSVSAWFVGVNLGTLGWIEVASGVIVIIGAFLIFMPRKETIGSVLAITFSLVGALVLGSMSLMFAPMGILGGVLGLLKDSVNTTMD